MKEERMVMRVALIRMQHKQLSRAFLTWFDMSLFGQAQEAAMMRGLLYWMRKELTSAFEMWQVLTLALALTLTLSLSLVLILILTLTHIWMRWQVFTDTAHDDTATMRGILLHMSNRALSMAFKKWLEFLDEKTEQVVMFKTATSWLRRVMLETGFEKWRCYTLEGTVREILSA